MSDTPETDKLAASNPQSTTVIWSHARTLETQRDEARAEVERLRKALIFITPVLQIEANPETRPPGKWDWRLLARTAETALDLPLTPTVTTNHTSPEIFEAHGREWYRHTPGDKMPCDGEMMVKAVLRGGDLAYCGDSVNASYIEWGIMFYREYDVTGWRPADAPEKLERK